MNSERSPQRSDLNIKGLLGGTIQGIPLNLKLEVSRLAGSDEWGSTDGAGSIALFYDPKGITTDGKNLYVADMDGSTIRKLDLASGIVTTLAGSGVKGDADGMGKAATFRNPTGITTDGKNLYVTDTENHNIRKIDLSNGAVTIIAGSNEIGVDNSMGTSAKFITPRDITTDGINLYLVDDSTNQIRKISLETYVVSTVAGSRKEGSLDGIGSQATFRRPNGITTDGVNLYVTDWNYKIRKIVITTGMVTTLAGSGKEGVDDGTGEVAQFKTPRGITTDGTYLYVADENSIRKIVIATGVVSTILTKGRSSDGDAGGKQSSVSRPHSVTNDGKYLYVTDQFTVLKIQ